MVLLPFLFSNYVVSEEISNHIRIGEFYLNEIAENYSCDKVETKVMTMFVFNGDGNLAISDTNCKVITDVNFYNMYGDRNLITSKVRKIFTQCAYYEYTFYNETRGDSVKNDFELFDKHNIK